MWGIFLRQSQQDWLMHLKMEAQEKEWERCQRSNLSHLLNAGNISCDGERFKKNRVWLEVLRRQLDAWVWNSGQSSWESWTYQWAGALSPCQLILFYPNLSLMPNGIPSVCPARNLPTSIISCLYRIVLKQQGFLGGHAQQQAAFCHHTMPHSLFLLVTLSSNSLHVPLGSKINYSSTSVFNCLH